MAYDFNGTTDLISFAASGLTNDLSSYTVSAWVQRDGNGGTTSGRIFDKGISLKLLLVGHTGSTNVGGVQSTISYGSGTANVRGSASGGIPVDSTWRHVCVTWSGGGNASSIAIYINGAAATPYQSDGNGTGSATSDAGTAIVIGNRSGADRGFDGKIAEFALFSGVLTVGEIQSLAKGFSPRRVSPQTLSSYNSILRQAIDAKTGSVGTVTGATVATHPRVYG